MNKKEREFLEEIYNDCLALEKNKDLTEFSAGQGILCSVLLDKQKKRPFKIENTKRIKCKNCKKIYSLNYDEECLFCGSKKLIFLRG